MNCKDISNSSSVISIFAESIKCWQGTTFVVQGATFCSGSYIKPVLCCTNQFPHPEDFSCFSLNYVNISNHLHKSRSSKFSGSLSAKPRPDFFPYLYNQDITSRITLTWGRPTYLKKQHTMLLCKNMAYQSGKACKAKDIIHKENVDQWWWIFSGVTGRPKSTKQMHQRRIKEVPKEPKTTSNTLQASFDSFKVIWYKIKKETEQKLHHGLNSRWWITARPCTGPKMSEKVAEVQQNTFYDLQEVWSTTDEDHFKEYGKCWMYIEMRGLLKILHCSLLS